MRPAADGRPVPVAGQWVVMHRVGTGGGAPLDSARSGGDGRYRLRYAATAEDPDALFFVSARYAGIAYFSPPLRGDTVRGGDADVMVYDTSADGSPIRTQGRHLVVSAPRGSRREVAEIFELENGTSRTIVARDSVTPVWATVLPARAESAAVAPGEVSAGAVAFKPGRAELYAPVSPGVRQLAITYVLPASAFPLSTPIERPVSVLEVLLEEPRASVDGAGLAEVAPASIDGRPFRRFLAQDVPASAVMRVTPPPPVAQNRSAMAVLGLVVAIAMAGAMGLWVVQHRKGSGVGRWASGGPRASEVEPLIAELAALDTRFEKDPAADGRAHYEAQRADLKARIARALAADETPG